MPSIRERFDSLFPGPRQRRQVTELLQELNMALERRNHFVSPPIRELDSQSMANLLRHSGDIRLTVAGDYNEIYTDEDRKQAVLDCRSGFYWDVIQRRIINLWTEYCCGLNVDIVPEDEAAIEPWNEFFTANRNRPILGEQNLPKLSDRLLTDGELFVLHFIARKGGLVTIRTIPPEEIVDFVCSKADRDVVYFYHRQWSDVDGMHNTYYRDWTVEEGEGEDELPSEAELAHELNSDTDVQVMHIKINTLAQRGVPLMMPGVEWTRQYREFLWGRAAVARAIATYVDEMKVKGGSRALAAIKSAFNSALDTSGSYFESNPPNAPGSTLIHNEGVDYKRQPMATGAGDAAQDAALFLAMAGLAGGVPPHLLGNGDVVRWATATAMGGPLYREWTRYQGLWKSIWRDEVDLVLTAQEVFGNKTFASHKAEVHLDPIPEETMLELSQALAPAVGGGFLKASVAEEAMMEALGKKAEESEPAMPGAPAVQAPDAQPAPTKEETPTEDVPVAAESEVWATLGQDIINAAQTLREVAEQRPFELGEYGTAASGNYGHGGVKGQQGGSAPGGGYQQAVSSPGSGAAGKVRKPKVGQRGYMPPNRLETPESRQPIDEFIASGGGAEARAALFATAAGTIAPTTSLATREQALKQEKAVAWAEVVRAAKAKDAPARAKAEARMKELQGEADKLYAEQKRKGFVADQGVSEDDVNWGTGNNPIVRTGLDEKTPVEVKVLAIGEIKNQPEFAASMERGVKGVVSMISNPELAGVKVYISDFPGKTRSNANGDTIEMSLDAGERTAAHEFGHVIESYSLTAHQQAYAFLKKRAGSEKSTRLPEVDGYGDDEIAFRDKFMHPYMGKDYKGGATEIISMGVEAMRYMPKRFAKEDPEYFDFMYRILKGKKAK